MMKICISDGHDIQSQGANDIANSLKMLTSKLSTLTKRGNSFRSHHKRAKNIASVVETFKKWEDVAKRAETAQNGVETTL